MLNAFHRAGKPIGAICISPAVVVKALGSVSVTIGSDPGTIDALTAMGASHVTHTVDECHIDEQNNVITAPAYMLDAPINEIALGITAAVNAVIQRA